MLKKIVYISAVVIFSIVLLVFLFISPIAKHIVEKNSEEWTGRKITMERLWINIFAGSVHIENLKLFENKSEDVFVSITDFYCNIEMLKLISKKYTISEITIKKPEINIIQSGSKFNFDDLVKRFTSDSTKKEPEEPSELVKYFIEKNSIDSAIVNYITTTPITTTVSIIDLNISSPPITYLDIVYNIHSDFSVKSGGRVSTLLNMNIQSLGYNLDLKMDDLNLAFLTDYMKQVMKIKSFDGIMNSDMKIAGDFDKATDFIVSGKLGLDNFSIVDTTDDKLMSFSSYKMDVNKVNTKAGEYDINSVLLNDPFIKFAMYEDGTNFDRVIVTQEVDTAAAAPVEEYNNIFQMLAGHITKLVQDYAFKGYKLDKFSLQKGHVIFTDYTLNEIFHFDLDSLSVKADSMDSRNERVTVSLASRLNKSGVMEGKLSVKPLTREDMDIYYSIKGLYISDINPYSKYYVATPFFDGVLAFENKSNITGNYLKSTNKLLIEKIKAGNKTGNPVYDLPVKLAIAILRDPKGNIDFDIPVEGDLNDPKFNIWPVVGQVLKNLIIKAAATPYKLMAGALGGKEKDYQEIQFEYMQKDLSEDQTRILDNLKKVLDEEPELAIEFTQVNNKKNEIGNLAVYKTKKEYLGFTSDSLTIEEEKKVKELSGKDSAFAIWVNNLPGINQALKSVEEKCVNHIGKKKLTTEVLQIMEQRNAVLLNYFTEKGMAANRIKVSNAKEADQAPNPRYLITFTAVEEESPKPEQKVKAQITGK